MKESLNYLYLLVVIPNLQKNLYMNTKMFTIILIAIIPTLLGIFFTFSLYFFPNLYLSTGQISQALPKIVNVSVNTSSFSGRGILHLGESFVMTITTANVGDTADFQITSVSFPNITSDINDNIANNKIVSIIHHNFTQSPVFIPVGDDIGAEYTGLTKTIIAKYPSIEFYNSPWTTNTFYETQLRVQPVSEGNFVVLVKAVALPHTSDLSHYPAVGAVGIRDQEQEFVNAYHINVVR